MRLEKLFNSSLDGNTRRAIDIRERENPNETAFKELIRVRGGRQLRGSGPTRFQEVAALR